MEKILANRAEGGLFSFLPGVLPLLFSLSPIFLVGLVCWGAARPLATGARSVVPMVREGWLADVYCLKQTPPAARLYSY